jgi:hypothetical protein
MDRLREEETVARMQLQDAEVDDLNAEAVVAFATEAIANAAGL